MFYSVAAMDLYKLLEELFHVLVSQHSNPCIHHLWSQGIMPSVFSDINECLPNNGFGPCQQICNNTNGSFYCGCYNGYALAPDLLHCNGMHCVIQDNYCIPISAFCVVLY